MCSIVSHQRFVCLQIVVHVTFNLAPGVVERACGKDVWYAQTRVGVLAGFRRQEQSRGTQNRVSLFFYWTYWWNVDLAFDVRCNSSDALGAGETQTIDIHTPQLEVAGTTTSTCPQRREPHKIFFETITKVSWSRNRCFLTDSHHILHARSQIYFRWFPHARWPPRPLKRPQN